MEYKLTARKGAEWMGRQANLTLFCFPRRMPGRNAASAPSNTSAEEP